jgi:hypothetical protein
MILQIIKENDLFEIAENLKFFDKNLNEIYSPQTISNDDGLVGFIHAEQRYFIEKQFIDKLLLIKELVQKNGDDAIKCYENLTKNPDRNHPMYNDIEWINKFTKMDWSEVLIPMKKPEFNIYLTIFKKYFNNNS